jgi:hypothetical protein
MNLTTDRYLNGSKRPPTNPLGNFDRGEIHQIPVRSGPIRPDPVKSGPIQSSQSFLSQSALIPSSYSLNDEVSSLKNRKFKKSNFPEDEDCVEMDIGRLAKVRGMYRNSFFFFLPFIFVLLNSCVPT